jgi:protein SCO1/2
MSDDVQQSGGGGVLFAVGSVLWVAVFVAVYFSWSGRATPNAPGFGQSIGKPIPLAELTGSGSYSESDDENETGIPASIEIELTWPESGVAEFTFTDQSGQDVSTNDLRGQPWVASFIFTKCAGPCPRVTQSVQSLFKTYRDKDVRFVTFTVDPARDTPKVLADYASFYEADVEKWFFLTGDRDKLYRLINASFLMPVREEENPEPGYEIIHTLNICLVDPTGRVVGKYNSVDAVAIVKLRRDLDQMLESLPLREAESTSDEASGS